MTLAPFPSMDNFNSTAALYDYVCGEGSVSQIDFEPFCPFPHINANWGSDTDQITPIDCSASYAQVMGESSYNAKLNLYVILNGAPSVILMFYLNVLNQNKAGNKGSDFPRSFPIPIPGKDKLNDSEQMNVVEGAKQRILLRLSDIFFEAPHVV